MPFHEYISIHVASSHFHLCILILVYKRSPSTPIHSIVSDQQTCLVSAHHYSNNEQTTSSITAKIYLLNEYTCTCMLYQCDLHQSFVLEHVWETSTSMPQAAALHGMTLQGRSELVVQ